MFGCPGQPEAELMKRLVATTGLALAVAMPAAAQDAATAKAEFVNMAGEKNGTATLTETAQGVLIELEVTGLPAGEWVAFHVHETGKCDHQTGHDSGRWTLQSDECRTWISRWKRPARGRYAKSAGRRRRRFACPGFQQHGQAGWWRNGDTRQGIDDPWRTGRLQKPACR